MKDFSAKLYNCFIDYLTIVLGWGIVAVCRWKMLYHLGYAYTKEWNGFRHLDSHFYEKWFLWVPMLSVSIFTFLGAYAQAPFMKSRAREIYQTIAQTFLVSILLFFLTLLKEYTNYWHGISVFLLLWFWFFVVVCIGRLILLQYFKNKNIAGKIGFNILIVGYGEAARNVLHEFENIGLGQGYRCIGYVPYLEDDANDRIGKTRLRKFSSKENLAILVQEQKIRMVVLAPDQLIDQKIILRYIAELSSIDVDVMRLPNEIDYFSGNIQTEDILSVPLVRVNPVNMPIWQQNAKRLGDVIFACLGIVIGSPLILYTAIRTKRSSPGCSVIYSQERFGRNAKPFKILKFRSMYKDAEAKGPQLSSDNDDRITPWGKTMRKWRLDELPQLWNILKGDMSLVGPRPERAYYIERLSEEIPYYKYLLKVRPGLTSWGMVKYGYACNIDQMKERIKYDLVYLENASLLVDLKILIYTVRILFLGKGK